MNNQGFSKIRIVVIALIFLFGGIFVWQYFETPEEEDVATGIIEDIDKYLHGDAVLKKDITLMRVGGVTPMMVEAGYFSISAPEVLSFAIQHLKAKSIKEIKICEVSWIAAPLGSFLIDGKGIFNVGAKHYSTFRIGIRDGSESNAGEEFVFMARDEDDKGVVTWYPEPGPDFHVTEGEIFPEEFLSYKFLDDREKFENLSSRFK